jgi:hypothetical protein
MKRLGIISIDAEMLIDGEDGSFLGEDFCKNFRTFFYSNFKIHYLKRMSNAKRILTVYCESPLFMVSENDEYFSYDYEFRENPFSMTLRRGTYSTKTV